MQLKGLYIPVTTPFLDEKPAGDKLIENLAKWNQLELSGYVMFGSSGEAPLVTKEERVSLVKTARKVITEKKTLIVGTGYESTAETIAFTLAAADLGADAALVLTPNYYKQHMTDDVLLRHYATVADRSPIPIILYNVPVFTGVDMSANVVRKLAEHEKIVGIKDSTANITKLLELTQIPPKAFSLVIGNAANYLTGLFFGAAGAILAVGNIASKECLQIYQRFCAGAQDEARAIFFRILPLATKMVGPLGVPTIKAAMDRLGLFGGAPRPPLMPVDDKLAAEIEQRLRAAELL
jgi:4-hydroxy-2-oxoglutarate aldolase